MRKFGFFLAIFFIALAGNIAAQTYYGIEIAGVMVTSANCDSITGGGITGSVSYNHESKTLILKNATIEGNIHFGSGESMLENITITLVGENTITYGGISSVTNTKTINGSGSLKTELLSSDGEQNTIIEDCIIDIKSEGDWAMFGADGKLTIKNANLSSEGPVAIGDFADIELIDCEIVEPTNAQIIDNEYDGYPGKYICNEDSTIATKVVIKRISATDYGIQVAGVKVTSENCNNITGANISGSVYYTPETKTLTLDNATIEGYIGFNDEVEDITITLVGENTVTQYLKTVKGTKRINGTGSLKAVGIWGAGEQNTIIEDCTIDITALGIAIAGNSKLTIKNADISAEGDVAIGDFADIELVDCEIVEPANAQIIDTTLGDFVGKFICNEDGTFAEKVVIKKLSGLNDIAQNNSITIYPNPASDKVTIEGKGEIKIINSLGQIVKEIKDNSTYRTLNIKDFERGVYYIKVSNTTQKLVVE